MKRLGILGGGQLAQMLTQSAISLGIETAIFERKPDSPASRLTKHDFVGDWQDEVVLKTFAESCDVVTLENEFVDAGVLRRLESMGKDVFPSADTLENIQDKFRQKTVMEAHGVPISPFREVKEPHDIVIAGEAFGWPLLLKARRDGYDGYGNETLHDPDDIDEAWKKLDGDNGRALMVEAFVPFKCELAVMVLRGRDGQVRTYPVVETVQQNHICHVVRAPADIAEVVSLNALHVAIGAVEAINGVGVFGVELFLLEDQTILFNEIAPRPHNSGHYSIEGCVTSQFENHIRAVMGWPTGSTDLRAPAVVMVNVLGDREGTANPDALAHALQIENAHFHLYSKRDVRQGRKMGHVTVLADNIAKAESIARSAADLVQL